MTTSPATRRAEVVLLAGLDAAAVDVLRPAAELLESFGVEVEMVVISEDVEAGRFDGGCAVIVASSDGVLPAAVSSATELPVIRVPVQSGDHRGLGLLSDGHANPPAGTGIGIFATMAIGAAGAKNAALFVVSTLALQDERLRAAYADYRARQTDAVLNHLPLES